MNLFPTFKDYQQNEVDFAIKQGLKITRLMQVTYASDTAGIDRREIRALLKAGNELGCRDLRVITWDCEEELKIENNTIRCVPLWKWLLL